MPIYQFFDVKYSIGDLMYESLARVYRFKDAQMGLKNIAVTNDYGDVVTIRGGQLKRFLLLVGFEADKWIVDIQDALKNKLDISDCPADNLQNIAMLLAADLSEFATERAWRQQLKVQTEILKRKGTPEGIVILVKFLAAWSSGVELSTVNGFGEQSFGVSSYGGGNNLNTTFRLVVSSAHAADPKKALKEALINNVLPKYLPVGATFEIVYA